MADQPNFKERDSKRKAVARRAKRLLEEAKESLDSCAPVSKCLVREGTSSGSGSGSGFGSGSGSGSASGSEGNDFTPGHSVREVIASSIFGGDYVSVEIPYDDSSESDCDDSSCCSENDIEVCEDVNEILIERLRKLVFEHNFTDKATHEVLELFRLVGQDVPKTRATLLQTPVEKVVPREVPNGGYLHFGIEEYFLRLPENSPVKDLNSIQIDINVDGIKIFTGVHLWQILGGLSIDKNLSPFLIGLFEGDGEPKDRDLYLQEFISEVNHLVQNGVHVTSSRILKPFMIRFFCCDAPARAFICGIMGHRSKEKGCSRCINSSVQIVVNGKKKLFYSVTAAASRTDDDYRNRVDGMHHKSRAYWN